MRFLFSILFCSWCSIAQAAVAEVGTVSFTYTSASATWTHTLSQSPTAGNLLLIGCIVNSNEGDQNTTCSVKDSAGNALNQAVTNNTNDSSASADPYLFYEIAPSGLTSSVTITVGGNTGGGGNPYPAESIGMEYSGVLSSSPVEKTAIGTNGGDPVITWNTASQSVTAGDVLIGLVTENGTLNGNAWTTGAGWNKLKNYVTNSPTLVFSDQVNVSSGSYNYSGTYNSNDGGTNVLSVFASFLEQTIPIVTTQATTSISTTTATGNGNITNTGSSTPTLIGVVYGTTSVINNPGNVAPGSSGYTTYADTSGTFSSGAFTQAVTGLTPYTKYFMRAFAENASGYAYGSEVNFSTGEQDTIYKAQMYKAKAY